MSGLLRPMSTGPTPAASPILAIPPAAEPPTAPLPPHGSHGTTTVPSTSASFPAATLASFSKFRIANPPGPTIETSVAPLILTFPGDMTSVQFVSSLSVDRRPLPLRPSGQHFQHAARNLRRPGETISVLKRARHSASHPALPLQRRGQAFLGRLRFALVEERQLQHSGLAAASRSLRSDQEVSTPR